MTAIPLSAALELLAMAIVTMGTVPSVTKVGHQQHTVSDVHLRNHLDNPHNAYRTRIPASPI